MNELLVISYAVAVVGSLLAGLPVLGLFAYRPVYGMILVLGLLATTVCLLLIGAYVVGLIFSAVTAIMVVAVARELVKVWREPDEKTLG